MAWGRVIYTVSDWGGGGRIDGGRVSWGKDGRTVGRVGVWAGARIGCRVGCMIGCLVGCMVG